MQICTINRYSFLSDNVCLCLLLSCVPKEVRFHHSFVFVLICLLFPSYCYWLLLFFELETHYYRTSKRIKATLLHLLKGVGKMCILSTFLQPICIFIFSHPFPLSFILITWPLTTSYFLPLTLSGRLLAWFLWQAWPSTLSLNSPS